MSWTLSGFCLRREFSRPGFRTIRHLHLHAGAWRLDEELRHALTVTPPAGRGLTPQTEVGTLHRLDDA